jgi:hypothetical protein
MPQYPLNRTYKALFTEFNRCFFDGRLPSYRIVVVPCIITQSWVHGNIYRRQRLSKILERPDHGDMAPILIHEMAHAATTDAHGPRFSAEMKRLQQIGASVQDYEFNPLPRPAKGLVRVAAEDALTDVPQATLRQFVRVYARDNGLSAAELLRRYRWIRLLFSQ